MALNLRIKELCDTKYKIHHSINLHNFDSTEMLPHFFESVEKVVNFTTKILSLAFTLKLCDIYIFIIVMFVFFIIGCILKNQLMKNNENGIMKQMEWHVVKSLTNKKSYNKCKNLIMRHPNLINILRNKKYTPFQIACHVGNEDLVLFMLKYGANVFTNHYKNRGTLFLATQAVINNNSTNFNILKMLISSHAPMNEPDSEGVTPLMLAALHGRADLVKWFLAHGADPSIKWKNILPWRLALQNGHEETAALLFIKDI